MLKWRPSNNAEAVLQVQRAIKENPGSFDCNQLYYYVTDLDIENHLKKSGSDVTREETGALLTSVGLSLENDVYEIKLPAMDTTGYFVSANALERAGIDIPPWNTQPPQRSKLRGPIKKEPWAR